MIARKNSVIATVVAAVFIATGPSFAGQGRGSERTEDASPEANWWDPHDSGEGAFGGHGAARFPKRSEIHVHDGGRRRRQRAQDDEHVAEVWDRER